MRGDRALARASNLLGYQEYIQLIPCRKLTGVGRDDIVTCHLPEGFKIQWREAFNLLSYKEKKRT